VEAVDARNSCGDSGESSLALRSLLRLIPQRRQSESISLFRRDQFVSNGHAHMREQVVRQRKKRAFIAEVDELGGVSHECVFLFVD
jgi:hypothetical protein